ncbi:hypothetical protein HMPREF9372_1230 [Sporosarcina newyorkensis 2681]|uniref:Uncharacterized protein n=1 Tax=Sporosarcina newyorkensis 2681 TaxID=1027292 RepID=F9DR00_9BACL|nr:hypothetical protein HMPREF9372_1230 [Sporosarcina newyorkensis 2681]
MLDIDITPELESQENVRFYIAFDTNAVAKEGDFYVLELQSCGI